MECPESKTLQLFIEDHLVPQEQEAFEEHLRQCSSCQEALSQAGANSTGSLTNRLRAALVGKKGDTNSDLNTPGELEELLKRDPDQDESVPEQIGPYKISGFLGKGGMGTVYKGLHVHLKRQAAIKVIRSSRQLDESAIARFNREIEASGKLMHPNIVQAFDAGVYEGQPYLVMEYLEGCDLSRWVKDHGPMSIPSACETIRQAALGLYHAHEAGLAHRDIKPSNLWRLPDGTIKILDLGLARFLATPTESLSGQVVGTQGFMSPEQTQGVEVDHRSDIYSLGCTFCYLLAGTTPLPFGVLPLNRCPKRIISVLKKMLAVKPQDRYQSALELAGQLKASAFQDRLRFSGIAMLAILCFFGFSWAAWKMTWAPDESPENFQANVIPIAGVSPTGTQDISTSSTSAPPEAHDVLPVEEELSKKIPSEEQEVDENRLLTVAEVAKRFRISQDEVYRLIVEEYFPTHKDKNGIFQFKISEIDPWMKSYRSKYIRAVKAARGITDDSGQISKEQERLLELEADILILNEKANRGYNIEWRHLRGEQRFKQYLLAQEKKKEREKIEQEEQERKEQDAMEEETPEGR